MNSHTIFYIYVQHFLCFMPCQKKLLIRIARPSKVNHTQVLPTYLSFSSSLSKKFIGNFFKAWIYIIVYSRFGMYFYFLFFFFFLILHLYYYNLFYFNVDISTNIVVHQISSNRIYHSCFHAPNHKSVFPHMFHVDLFDVIFDL